MTTTGATNVGDSLRRHAGWFLLLGIALLVLGLIALAATFATTVFSMVFLGWLLLVSAVAHAVSVFQTRGWKGMVWHLILAIVDVVAGIWLIAQPVVGAITLTLFLALFLIAQGVFQVIFALSHPLPNKGWAIFSGLISIVLGFMVWSSWPSSALWFIGMCVAIGLIFRGWALIALSMAVKSAGTAPPSPTPA